MHEDVLAVDEVVGGHHLVQSDLFLVDAHAVGLGHLSGFTFGREDVCVDSHEVDNRYAGLELGAGDVLLRHAVEHIQEGLLIEFLQTFLGRLAKEDVGREAGLKPSCVVIVATIRALKMHGGVKKEDLGIENVIALEAGFENLEKHIENIKKFNLPYVVAINRFTSDTEAELKALENWSIKNGHPVSLSEVWAKGGEGAIDLANKVIDRIENGKNDFRFIYEREDSIKTKIEKICKEIYGASNVEYTQDARNQISRLTKLGFDNQLVCMAKTQYSLSDNPKLLGRPEDFTVTIRGVTPSIGAGFIVALSGEIMRMPGLPKAPAAERMDVVDGKIVGLF